MARISLDPPRGPMLRIAEWYSRRKYGAVMDPLRAAGHNPRVLGAVALYESRVAKWRDLDPGLKHLAEMVSASRIGCTWCMDFGYWLADDLGLPMEKIRYVPAWRENRERFGELELLVMEFAEAMTETEPAVTDAMTEELIGRLGEKAFVELAAIVAVENHRSRMNAALGLVGQGFSDRCAVQPVQKGAAGGAGAAAS
ncbi:carboxymuconolactone decarboxylase family protein [Streptomyces sp. WMMB 322]|uniref:carboxymuconolactone decarboxylase family protein n=1 Tax=Streptomyces sp. WMMB 322 TaxID=1286821 RepID=UPI0006E1C326|nr:carboxymuconolactone decarboxylase family protein [Streptomyces sp. WMMB 322]SCK22554.1 Alkylhydroperoxidase family enzyme, contains CxxC motif [Streptomyces sp. WMMB 322]